MNPASAAGRGTADAARVIGALGGADALAGLDISGKHPDWLEAREKGEEIRHDLPILLRMTVYHPRNPSEGAGKRLADWLAAKGVPQMVRGADDGRREAVVWQPVHDSEGMLQATTPDGYNGAPETLGGSGPGAMREAVMIHHFEKTTGIDARLMEDTDPIYLDEYEDLSMNPDIVFGKVRVRGTRISLANILEMSAGGVAPDEMHLEWDAPKVTGKAVREGLRYAAHMVYAHALER